MDNIQTLCRYAYQKDGELGLARLVADNEELYNAFHRKENNLVKPEPLAVYESKDWEAKMRYDREYPDWRHRCGADVYETQSVSIRLENESNLLHLQRYENLLTGDLERQIKIKELIEEYEPQQVAKIKNEFDGRVVHRGHIFSY